MAEKKTAQGQRSGGSQNKGAQSKSSQSKSSQSKSSQSESQSKQSRSQSQGSSQSNEQSSRSQSSGKQSGTINMENFDQAAGIQLLNQLLEVDYDAVGMYDRCLQLVDNDQFKQTLASFRDDHVRHINDLSNTIRELGGEPANRPSIMGPIGKVMASFASTLMGNKGALQALLQGEQYSNGSYDNAPIATLPDQIRKIVEKNQQDEHRHLQWVTETLKGM